MTFFSPTRERRREIRSALANAEGEENTASKRIKDLAVLGPRKIPCNVNGWPQRPELPLHALSVLSTWYIRRVMFADRKASFKQPPRHDTSLSQEARRNKVCPCESMRITVSLSHNRIARLWKSRNACDTYLLHQNELFNRYYI